MRLENIGYVKLMLLIVVFTGLTFLSSGAAKEYFVIAQVCFVFALIAKLVGEK